MVAYDEQATDDAGPKTVFIDVFDGGRLLQTHEATRLIEQTTGREVEEEHIEPATPRAMILRLLYNLTSFSKKPEQALPYLDLIVTLDPDAAQERLQRALMRMRGGDIAGTKEDLETLLSQKPDNLDMEKVELLYRSL